MDLLRGPADELAAWVDSGTRAAEYYALLADVSDAGPGPVCAEGFPPEDLADRVRRQPLDDAHRRCPCAATRPRRRFALARRKAILGNGTGLGKTVQAIAATAHLAAEGEKHFLVVCPASVLLNSMREIEARATLPGRLLHGPDRPAAFEDRCERAGIGVTIYRGAARLPRTRPGAHPDGAGQLVVDEAHLVKNPRANAPRRSIPGGPAVVRTLRTHPVSDGHPDGGPGRGVRNTVRILEPALAGDLGTGDVALGSAQFRAKVAPVCLRRNQADVLNVLNELPRFLHTDEWEQPSRGDEWAYREAVATGNFMAVRRAAWARTEGSAKLGRLVDPVTEAGDNGLKVVVFSYFRDVLDAESSAPGAAPTVTGPVLGPAQRRRATDGPSADRRRALRRPRSLRADGPDPDDRARPRHPGRLRRDPVRAADQTDPRPDRPSTSRPSPASTAWAGPARPASPGCSPRAGWTSGSSGCWSASPASSTRTPGTARSPNRTRRPSTSRTPN